MGHLNYIRQIKKMGNLMNTNEQQINDLIKGEYEVLDYPYLLHRSTKQFATIYKVTTRSQFESKKIISVIEEYNHSKCSSILKLTSHYFVNHSGYCSDEQNYYLVFQGRNDYSLHEEYLKRRLQGIAFKEAQIIQIVECYLSGLRQFDHRFQSQYQNLLLSSIIIDQQSLKMNLQDPFINRNTSSNDFNDHINKIMVSYPSPQKLNITYNSAVQDYNVFLSNLFSIGMIALELNNLQFVDDVYKNRKEVNYNLIREKINQIKDGRLRKGVQCLVDLNPFQRKKIYQIWGIQNKQQHFLEYSMNRNINKSRNTPLEPEIVIKSPPVSQINSSYTKPIVLPYQSNNPNLLSHQLPTSANNTSNSIKFATPIVNNLPTYSQQQPLKNMYSSVNEPQKPFGTSNNISFKTKSINPPTQRSGYNPPTTFRNDYSQQNRTQSKSLEKPFIFQDFMKKNHETNNKVETFKSTQAPSFKFNNYSSLTTSSHINNTSNPIGSSFTHINHTSNPINTSYSLPQNNFKPLSNYEPYNPSSHLAPLAKPLDYKPYSHSINTPPNNPNPFNTNVNSNVSTFGNLGPFKQSITYYDNPSNRSSNGENIQAYLDSLKEREIKSILIEEKKQNLPIFNKKKEEYIQPVTLTSISKQTISIPNLKVEAQQSKQAKTSHNTQSPIIIKKEQYQIEENYQHQEIKSNTPHKPTGKNKYNSTIVEVRDEDSPDHSLKSEEGGFEEEYVVEEYETGSRYEGFKSNNMRNGRGKFYYQDGGYYEGQWKNNKMDGYGKLYYEGGKLAYEGSWYQDEFNGQGKVYNDNPVHLATPFDYTNFDELQDFWQYYEGTLARDTKEGRGRIKLSNGQLFEGDFHNDRIQGFGKFYTMDSRVVQGIWRQSRLIKIIKSD